MSFIKQIIDKFWRKEISNNPLRISIDWEKQLVSSFNKISNASPVPALSIPSSQPRD